MKNDDFQVHNLRSREAVEKLRVGAEREFNITLKGILAKEKLFKKNLRRSAKERGELASQGPLKHSKSLDFSLDRHFL